MGNFIDLTGKIFGRLTVVNLSHKEKKLKSSGSYIFWDCVCECGSSKKVKGYHLRNGHVKSCGCLQTDNRKTVKHGECKRGKTTPRLKLLYNAKRRAKKNNIPFDLELEDVVIPEFCPILTYIKLEPSNGKVSDSSPSLDKIIPELGYIKGNVQVISHKANTMKSNGTFEDIELLYKWAIKSKKEL